MKPQYIDVHSHLFFKEYDHDLEEVLSRMRDEEVWTITVGVNRATSQAAVSFAEAREGFFATLGLHPNDAPNELFRAKDYEELVKNPNVVGIGECGIDYFRLQGTDDSERQQEKKRQRETFERHIEFAVKHGKALMLHCRPTKGTYDAYEDVLAVLEPIAKKKGEKLHGNVHFFVGDVAIARRFYDIGFTTSFTGVVTFAREYDEVVRFAPLSSILTETDSPFAAPIPFRGKRNEPGYVKYIVQAIANIRKADPEDVRSAVVENALRVFSLRTLSSKL